MTEREVGWHPDPGGSPMLRWWDGEDWADRWKPPEQPTDDPSRLIAVLLIVAVGFAVVFGVLWLLNNAAGN
jgi:hypothetical protein